MKPKCKWPGGCKSWPVKKYKTVKGYCFSHAKKMFPDDPELLAAEEMRVSGIRGSHADRKEKTKKELEIARAQKIANKEERNRENAAEFYHDIVQDKFFNLKTDIKESKGLDAATEKSALQDLFVVWLMADIETREPKTIKEVAEILDKKQIVLRRWMEEPTFNDKLERARANRNVRVLLQTDKSVAIDVLLGNKAALKEFYGSVSDKKPPQIERDIADIPEDLEKEIDDASGVTDNESGGLHLTDEEKEESEAISHLMPLAEDEPGDDFGK